MSKLTINNLVLAGEVSGEPTYFPQTEGKIGHCKVELFNSWTTPNGNEIKNFFSLSFWGKSSEEASKLKEGERIYVEGYLGTHIPRGAERSSAKTIVVVRNLQRIV